MIINNIKLVVLISTLLVIIYFIKFNKPKLTKVTLICFIIILSIILFCIKDFPSITKIELNEYEELKFAYHHVDNNKTITYNDSFKGSIVSEVVSLFEKRAYFYLPDFRKGIKGDKLITLILSSSNNDVIINVYENNIIRVSKEGKYVPIEFDSNLFNEILNVLEDVEKRIL